MRVISGYARGIQLDVPRGQDLRPTTDRVKESLFSVLGDLRGQAVVDLFAGTGALGLEALSRGAATVALVEKSRDHLRVLRANLARVQKALPADLHHEVIVLECDVLRTPQVLPDWAGRFDVILADPPYRPAEGGVGPREVLMDPELPRWAGQALLVLQHAAKDSLPVAPLSGWRVLRQQPIGTTALTYCRFDPAVRVVTAAPRPA